MNTPFRKNEHPQVKVEDDRLVISIGIHTLTEIAMDHLFFIPGVPDLGIPDDLSFAKDMACQLDLELEGTFIGMLESAAEDLYEKGATSIVAMGDDDDDEVDDLFAELAEDEEIEKDLAEGE